MNPEDTFAIALGAVVAVAVAAAVYLILRGGAL